MVNIRADKYIRYLQHKKMMEQQYPEQYIPPDTVPEDSYMGDFDLEILIAMIVISFWFPRLRIYVAEQWKPYFWVFVVIVAVYTLISGFARLRLPSPIVFLLNLINYIASFAIMNIILSNFMGGYPLSTMAHKLYKMNEAMLNTNAVLDSIIPILELVALVIETVLLFIGIPILQKPIRKVFRMNRK